MSTKKRFRKPIPGSRGLPLIGMSRKTPSGRKPPVRHHVSSHMRKRKRISSYMRGNGPPVVKIKKIRIHNPSNRSDKHTCPICGYKYFLTGDDQSRLSRGYPIICPCCKKEQLFQNLVKLSRMKGIELEPLSKGDVAVRAKVYQNGKLIGAGIFDGFAIRRMNIKLIGKYGDEYAKRASKRASREYRESLSKIKKKESNQFRKQLKMGIKVEKEHTDDPKLAEKIARDHLKEFPDYYTRLLKMEKEGKKAIRVCEICRKPATYFIVDPIMTTIHYRCDEHKEEGVERFPIKLKISRKHNPTFDQLVKKEMREHPWLTRKQAEKVVKDHMRKSKKQYAIIVDQGKGRGWLGTVFKYKDHSSPYGGTMFAYTKEELIKKLKKRHGDFDVKEKKQSKQEGNPHNDKSTKYVRFGRFKVKKVGENEYPVSPWQASKKVTEWD